MFPQPSPNLFGEGLKIVSSCPLCGTKFGDLETRILGEDGETRLLYISCQKCSNSLLALILISNSGVSSVGLITDLSYDDVLRFHQCRKVSTDDVIKIHQAVHDEGFIRQFSKRT